MKKQELKKELEIFAEYCKKNGGSSWYKIPDFAIDEFLEERYKKEIKHIDKPWGYERILEQNKDYVVKELFMKEGNSCSLQYHELKHETFYVLKGKLRFYVGKTKDDLTVMELNVGECYTIEPLVVHRMEAIVDSLYLESSTNHLDDVIRLEDKYGRI